MKAQKVTIFILSIVISYLLIGLTYQLTKERWCVGAINWITGFSCGMVHYWAFKKTA